VGKECTAIAALKGTLSEMKGISAKAKEMSADEMDAGKHENLINMLCSLL